jgi:chromosome partitioning protein
MKLVGIMEISKMAKVSQQAVCNWVVRYKDFPQPLKVLRMGSIWSASEIEKWLKERGKI